MAQIAEPELREAVDANGPDAGVIREARRRRRRERIAASMLLAAATGALLFLINQAKGTPAARASSPRPTWLTGAPLDRSTHLRLLASENGGPMSVVDVAHRRARAVRGGGLPRKLSVTGSLLWPLIALNGRALGIVSRRDCDSCVGTEAHFLISPNGSVRKVSTLRLRPDQSSTTPVLGSASQSWVLTHPRGGHCTLGVAPGSEPAVPVPCGGLVADTPAGSDTPGGLIISTNSRMILVNPHTGHLLARSPINGHLDVVSRSEVLISGPNGNEAPGKIGAPFTLVSLTTGARTQIRWPSTLTFGYEVFPEPRSPMVAIEFTDPAYAGAQASDVWLLNTSTGGFTHVPGFPILEYLKFSGLAWTTDHRLVIVSRGPRRTAIGIWRPGRKHLQVGTVPALSGYTALVPFSG